jgi:hypothetical protein
MKNIALATIGFLIFLLVSCTEKIDNEPLFVYDCAETEYYYNEHNDLINKGIRYFNKNLLVRSKEASGLVKYINYDHKQRIIKEGYISNGNHSWVEFIYGEFDTISEVRSSDKTKTLYLYNENRKLVESRIFKNNKLTFLENLTYTYFTDVEMIKVKTSLENTVYLFNISNSANLPVELDTISNYRLVYYTGNRLDSVFQFQNNQFIDKRIFKYNELKQPTYEEWSSNSFFDIHNWDYTLTNKVASYIHRKENSYYNDSFYKETQYFYNQDDELYKMENFYAPNELLSYTLVSTDGYYVFWNFFNPDSSFRGFTKFTPKCSEP